MRNVCTEINRLRVGAPLSRDEAITFKAQVRHYTSILNRCEFNWENGVPFIPHIFGKTRHDYWRARGKEKEKPEKKPEKLEILPVSGDPLFDKHWDLIQLLQQAVKQVPRKVSVIICEFVGCERVDLVTAIRALRIDPRCGKDWDHHENKNQKPWPDKSYELTHEVRIFSDGTWYEQDIRTLRETYLKYAGAFKKPKQKGRGRKIKYPDKILLKKGKPVMVDGKYTWREMKYREYVADEKRKYNEAQLFGRIVKTWGHI